MNGFTSGFTLYEASKKKQELLKQLDILQKQVQEDTRIKQSLEREILTLEAQSNIKIKQATKATTDVNTLKDRLAEVEIEITKYKETKLSKVEEEAKFIRDEANEIKKITEMDREGLKNQKKTYFLLKKDIERRELEITEKSKEIIRLRDEIKEKEKRLKEGEVNLTKRLSQTETNFNKAQVDRQETESALKQIIQDKLEKEKALRKIQALKNEWQNKIQGQLKDLTVREEELSQLMEKLSIREIRLEDRERSLRTALDDARKAGINL